ncbi:MAG: biopolymer transporter ExbD [Pseudomonadota bacterium]
MHRPSVFRRRRRAVEDDERILPLINIVFLLLIFFMVVGRLSAADPFEIEPTRSASDGAPANEPQLIAIGPQGELALNGTRIAEEDLIAQVAAAAAAGEDVRIKSDGRVQAAAVVALLDRLRLAGVASVRLMTVPLEPTVPGAVVPDAADGVTPETVTPETATPDADTLDGAVGGEDG